MKKIFLLSSALLILTSAMLLAGNEIKIGTAGAQELRIPVGSRGSALGGAMIANSYGAEALYWNPAGAANQAGTEAMFSHLEYFADMNLEYVAVTTTVEGFGTLGASVKVLSIGDMLKTTWDDQQGSSGETFNPTFSVIGLTYARQFTDRVSFGATAYFVNEKVEQVSARGTAFDFGFTYQPNWQGLKFGVVVKHIGPQMQFTGAGFDIKTIPDANDPNSAPKTVRTESEGFDLPSSIQFGVAWNALQNNEKNDLELSGTFQSNNFSQDEFKGGAEYGFNDTFFLRGGFVGSSQDDFSYGGSFGAGVKFNWGNSHVSFDYSWQQVDVTGFDDNQYFTVKFAF
ncbi:MAG: PorV/PorQ family protein [Candidatus Zixiibacteriota bacterium]